MKLNYHNIVLNQIKKEANLSFIAFEREGALYRVKFIKNGIRDTVDLMGEPKDIKPKYYQELKEYLIDYGS